MLRSPESRQLLWHIDGAGTPVNETAVEDALRSAGLDWTVSRRNVYFENADGEPVQDPERFAIVRDDTEDRLSYVSNGYVVFQNDEAFSFADDLVTGAGWHFDGGGTLRGGGFVWLSAKIPQTVQVAGVDDHTMYLHLMTSHDGSCGIRAIVTPIRMACTNAMGVAISHAQHTWSIRHTSRAAERMEEARESIQRTLTYVDEFKRTAEDLASRTVSEAEFMMFADRLLPKQMKTRDDAKQQLLQVFHNTPTMQDELKGTRWAAFNAVSEWVDWREQGRKDSARFQNSVLGSGSRLRERAHDLLTA